MPTPPTPYEIVLRGRASARVLQPVLGDSPSTTRSTVSPASSETSPMPPTLHGVVAHLTSVNVQLISVAPIPPPPKGGPEAASDPRPSHPLDDHGVEPMITISELTKRYGRRVAVDDLSFEVAAGRVTGFVGPNGADKSTTMRMMVGLTRPDRGEVRKDDRTSRRSADGGMPGRPMRPTAPMWTMAP
jgi:ABC-type glutathione transport system ATPase component